MIAPPRPPTPAQIDARLHAGAILHRNPYARAAWMHSGKGAELFIDGQAHACSLATAKCFAGPAPIAADTLAALDADGRRLMHDLVQRGCFLLSRVPRRQRT